MRRRPEPPIVTVEDLERAMRRRAYSLADDYEVARLDLEALAVLVDIQNGRRR